MRNRACRLWTAKRIIKFFSFLRFPPPLLIRGAVLGCVWSQKKELIEVNEEQKIKKKDRLVEQALSDEKEYENIVRYQIKEREDEKIMEQLSLIH